MVLLGFLVVASSAPPPQQPPAQPSAPLSSPFPSPSPVASPGPLPFPSPSPSPAPNNKLNNGTLDPSQIKALSALGLTLGPDPCNTASQHFLICDQSTPYRRALSLQLQYCPENAAFPASAWANLTSLQSLSFNDCPSKLMQLPTQLTDSLTSLTIVASLGRSVDNVLAPGLPGAWLSKFHNLIQLTVQDVDVNASSLSSILLDMTRLQQMTFSNTNLTGLLPKKWPLNLTALEISGNDMQGTIPTSLGQTSQLTSLDLSSCNLTGSIPTALANLSSLQSLKLDSNRLQGPIPVTLQKLVGLTYLDLSDNQLNGSVPLFLSHLPGLRYIDLSKNSFRGEIPFNDTFLQTLNTFKVSGNAALCYNSSTVSAKFVKGLQPCDSSGLPSLTPQSLSPSLAPAPQPHVQQSSHHRGPKKIVLIVAIALASIVGIIVIAILLSKCCSSKR